MADVFQLTSVQEPRRHGSSTNGLTLPTIRALSPVLNLQEKTTARGSKQAQSDSFSRSGTLPTALSPGRESKALSRIRTIDRNVSE